MPAPRPNIILLLADDLGYGDVSCLNPQSRIPTQHMDRMAREGMVFTDGHSPSSLCTPSRYGIYTGRYSWRSRLKSGLLWSWSPPLIEADRPTLPRVLRGAGYRTWFVGKWHLGVGWRLKDGSAPDPLKDADPAAIDFGGELTSGPHTLGFDHSYMITGSLNLPPYCFFADGRVTELPTAASETRPHQHECHPGPRAPGYAQETCLLELTQRCETLIDLHARSRDTAPFLLCFSMTSPHHPHVPRAPFRGATGHGPYADQVVEHDWSIGRILSALDRTGLARNTLVVATSDNCAALDHGLEAKCGHRSNHHFRGQKSDAWDGGHRVPLIARWPAGIRAGSSSDALVSLTDLFATSAALAGAALPPDAAPDSVDWSPLFADPAAKVRDTAIQHSAKGCFAVRDGSWKLVKCRGSGGWTKAENEVPADAPPEQLYELGGDVGEQRNRWSEMPEVVTRLDAILARELQRPV
jgi:arylsulfatase A-like enzyme